MDGGRRLAESATAGAAAFARRSDLTVAPLGAGEDWRSRFARLKRLLRRRFRAMLAWQIPRGAGAAAAAALLAISVVFGALRGDHVPAIVDGLREWRDTAARAVGFSITSFTVSGQRHLGRDEILATAGVSGRTSLLFFDAAAARAQLHSNPWIAKADVLKFYPGHLQITVVEREAFALWQKNGKVLVVAADGTVVQPNVDWRFVHLPLVVGVGAETKAKDFLALLDQFPAVRGAMRAAVLVAERRWNVALDNGIELRLPEFGIERALETLLDLDRDKSLLSRDIAIVDLRLPDRVVVRLTDEAAAARLDALKARSIKKKGGSV
jgi:cell division protein FtsQ